MSQITTPLGGALLLADQRHFRRLRGCQSVRIMEKYINAVSSRCGAMLEVMERCTACR